MLHLSLKIYTIGDMSRTDSTPQDHVMKILARIYGNGRGNVFTPKDFLDMAGSATARQVLSRLARSGKIRRLLRGVYDYPEYSQALQALASPDPHGIAQAIARAHGWTLLPAGETALNLVGLSTQVPARWEYFSDGPSRKYAWAGGTLIFRRRANREMTILSPRTGLLVQALKTLGREQVDDAVMATLGRQFNSRERMRAMREARYATAWVYEVIKRLASEGASRHA
jgi:hypothetical protein